MKKIYTLNSLHEGEKCRVKELLIDGKMRSRLSDLGLIEGTSVACLQKSSSGDPTAYLIRGAVIALRNEDSSRVIVQPI
ncbi:MAG: ferrous iron transport protein A [Ruminococcus sp.]|nr:ferrous iron transport protein A [Ruminococcus sp.]MCD7811146.1 ferrous iron transport protein A [Ruminococcus sp.]